MQWGSNYNQSYLTQDTWACSITTAAQNSPRLYSPRGVNAGTASNKTSVACALFTADPRQRSYWSARGSVTRPRHYKCCMICECHPNSREQSRIKRQVDTYSTVWGSRKAFWGCSSRTTTPIILHHASTNIKPKLLKAIVMAEAANSKKCKDAGLLEHRRCRWALSCGPPLREPESPANATKCQQISINSQWYFITSVTLHLMLTYHMLVFIETSSASDILVHRYFTIWSIKLNATSCNAILQVFHLIPGSASISS